jgi:Family of unknown function (DUF6312)
MGTDETQATRLPDSVLKVTRVEPLGEGRTRAVKVYSIEESGTRKRSSKRLRTLDKAIRKVLAAEEVAIDSYRELHERSSRREQDGWFHDLRKNLRKAGRRAKKKL